MAAYRCPQCQTALTAGEFATGTCPECTTPLAGGTVEALAVPDALPAPRRSWFAFPAGVAIGVLLALASAAGAWRVWGPAPFPAAEAGAPAATATEPIDVAAADERARQAEAVAQQAREAARQADAERAASEQLLTTVRNQVQVALGQLAAAEQERTAAESKLRAAQEQLAGLEKSAGEAEAKLKALKAKESDPAVQKARFAAQQTEDRRAAAERALADLQARAQVVKAQQQEQVRQAEEKRLAAERAVTDARVRLQATQAQQIDADKQLTAARDRLRVTKDQAAALDKELADKKVKLADQDRALQAKRAQLADLDRAVAAKPPAPAAPQQVPKDPPPDPKVRGGFVRDWLVVGPFPLPDRHKGHDTAFPPETGPVDPKKEHKAGADTVRWQAHASPENYVDFAGLFKTQDSAVGYAVCWVRASRVRSVVLSLGSNDGIKVWVGGKLVADRPVSRSAEPGQDRVTCQVGVEWTEVRVKVDNTGGPWGFYLEARDPHTDKPLAGLQVRATPPEPKSKK